MKRIILFSFCSCKQSIVDLVWGDTGKKIMPYLNDISEGGETIKNDVIADNYFGIYQDWRRSVIYYIKNLLYYDTIVAEDIADEPFFHKCTVSLCLSWWNI